MMLRRPLPHTVLLLIAMATTATWSARSSASEPPGATAPAEQASKFYQAGNVEFEKQNWAAAETAYLQAWSITRTFDVAANLGEVEFHLGKLREAAELLSYSIRTAPPSSKAGQRERTMHFLDQAKEKLGVVRVHINVEGARVSINGRPIPAEDLVRDVFVEPGACTVIANRDGYVEAKQSVEVKPGTPAAVTILLDPAPGAVRSRVPLVVLSVASAASLGLGIAMTVVSNGKSTDAETQRATILGANGQCAKPSSSFVGPCADMKSSLKSLDTTANVARVAYAASGLLLIAAVTYAVLPPPKPQAGWVRAAPVIGASSGGIVVTGAW